MLYIHVPLKLIKMGFKGSHLGAFCPFSHLSEKQTDFCFALFKSIFLRNRSLSNARWFYGKRRKIRKGNLHLTKNWLSRNETWCMADNYNYVCHVRAKGCLDSNFNQAVIDRISIFNKIAQNFTFSQKS